MTVLLVATWLGIAYACGIYVGKTRRIPWMPWRRWGEKSTPELMPGMPAESRLAPMEYEAASQRLARMSPVWSTLTPGKQQEILRRLGQKAETTLASVTK